VNVTLEELGHGRVKPVSYNISFWKEMGIVAIGSLIAGYFWMSYVNERDRHIQVVKDAILQHNDKQDEQEFDLVVAFTDVITALESKDTFILFKEGTFDIEEDEEDEEDEDDE